MAWQSLIYIRWAFSEYERNWCTMINVKIINCMCTLNVYRSIIVIATLNSAPLNFVRLVYCFYFCCGWVGWLSVIFFSPLFVAESISEERRPRAFLCNIFPFLGDLLCDRLRCVVFALLTSWCTACTLQTNEISFRYSLALYRRQLGIGSRLCAHCTAWTVV